MAGQQSVAPGRELSDYAFSATGMHESAEGHPFRTARRRETMSTTLNHHEIAEEAGTTVDVARRVLEAQESASVQEDECQSMNDCGFHWLALIVFCVALLAYNTCKWIWHTITRFSFLGFVGGLIVGIPILVWPRPAAATIHQLSSPDPARALGFLCLLFSLVCVYAWGRTQKYTPINLDCVTGPPEEDY